MTRAIASVLFLAALLPAQSALACGMYIPPETRSVSLAQLLEEVDLAIEEAPTVADVDVATAVPAFQTPSPSSVPAIEAVNAVLEATLNGDAMADAAEPQS